MREKIMFLGAGKMATAIAGGLTAGYAGIERQISAYDPNSEAAESFRKATGAEATSENPSMPALQADVVVLAVKPQYLAAAVEPLQGILRDKLVISIVAGAKLGRLVELTGAARVVRVMPNTPALIGRGVSCCAASDGVGDDDWAVAAAILGAVGKVIPCEERLLDAVTGLSGSGPAYVFEFIMALADGGVKEGLPRATALELAVQTVIGSAMLAEKTGTHPALLRDQVISPGGTTAAGVAELERCGFRYAVEQAVEAAARRSAELGGE